MDAHLFGPKSQATKVFTSIWDCQTKLERKKNYFLNGYRVTIKILEAISISIVYIGILG